MTDDTTEQSADTASADGERRGGGHELAAVVGELGRYLWTRARDRSSEHWPPWWLIAAALGVGAVVLVCFVAPILRGLAAAAAPAGHAATAWLSDQALSQVVTVPVHQYLDTHTAAMPVVAETLWWTWCISGALLFVLAVTRNVGGRVGWVGYGAATAGMVWTATPAPSQWVGVGVVGLWWSLLSVPAFRRRRPAPVVVVSGEMASAVSATAAGVRERDQELVEVDPRDDAARLAGVYERLVRRQQVRGGLLPPSQTAWHVTASGQGFSAVDESGRPVAGLARSAEAAAELLSGVSTPPGACPAIRWANAPVGTWMPDRLPYDTGGALPSMGAFLEASAKQRAELAAALLSARADWDLDLLAEKITARAAALNEKHPLISVTEFVPYEPLWDGEDLGYLDAYAWVDPTTVIGGNARHWNDFGDHRPEIVGLIIEKLLTADDPDEAVCEVLSDDGIVYMERADGPAGPIHQVTVNGTHRTHALRLLGAPMLAAEIRVAALPLRLRELSMWERGFTGSAEPLWRGLMRHGLLVGDIVRTKYGAVLEPHHVAAPWLLRPPAAAAKISAAYDRLYPGALGIPANAFQGRAGWCRWLED
ncbi:hypothetical protein [Micromonospora sp. CPCC 206061]|uniref:hypothetical protein n=1 Tax=Micromonospora sp. CPCC 206061 TaxID=3122410 RepID=UPI002FF19960